MKRRLMSLGRNVKYAVMVVALAGLFAACKKDNVDPVQIPAAGLMVFNLAPDQQAVGIALSGNLLSNSPLAYTSYNGNYQNIYTGTRDVAAYDFLKDSVLSRTSVDFSDSAYYSLFFVGNKGSYKTIVTRDDVDESTAKEGQAFIRFVNAVADSSAPVVTINAGGTDIFNEPATFATVSDFKAVNAGDVNIAIGNGSTIAADRTVPLEQGKIYTALLLGDPAATDTTAKVQIRYILNGTVSTASGQ